MLLDGVGEGRGKMRETDKRETDGWGEWRERTPKHWKEEK